MAIKPFVESRIPREIEIDNADFEIVTLFPGEAPHLRCWLIDDQNPLLYPSLWNYADVDSTTKYSGSYSCKITHDHYITTLAYYPILPGDTIRISAAMKADASATLSWIFVYWFTKDRTWLSLSYTDFGGNYDWKINSASFTAPEGAGYFKVGFYVYGGNLWVDNVTVVITSALEKVEVTNFPTEFPLPSSQVSDLKNVSVTNFPTEYPLPSSQVSDLRKIASRVSSAFYTGQVSVDTTAVQLTTTSTPLNFGIVVKADGGNTGTVYVGTSGVDTSTGYPLTAGEGIAFEIDDASKVYVVADSSGQKVYWLGV